MKKHTIYEFRLDQPSQPRRNVRINPDDGLLAPVGDPRPVGSMAPRLLGVVTTRAGDLVFSTDEKTVYATLCQSASSLPARVADVAYPPSCCIPSQGGVAVSFGEAGTAPLRIDVDSATGSSAPRPVLSRLGAPRLRRIDDGLLFAPLNTQSLKGVYTSRSSALDPDDVSTLTADFASAYRRISDMAAARHRFIQPVIATVTAFDSRGRKVYVSPPVMIAPDSGVQCRSVQLTLSGDSFATVAPARLQATPFSIGIEFPAEFAQWAGIVSTIRLDLSLQIHPVDFDGVSASRFESFTATTATLTLHAPGFGADSSGIYESPEFRRRAEGVLCRLDSLSVTAFTMNVGNGEAVPTPVNGIYASARGDCRSQLKSLLSALSKPLPAATPDDLALLSLNYPHTFGAQCGTTGGDTVLWGSLTARLFDGYTVAEYSTATSQRLSGTTPVTAIVTLDDGRRLVSSTQLSGAIPSEFSPLIVYPHPRARELTIMVGLKSLTVTLRPTPDGRMAYALAPGCRPLKAEKEEEIHVVPSADEVTESFPNFVASAPADDICRLTAIAPAGPSAPAAITVAGRGNSSLDFGRRRFYTFSPAGIFLTAINAAGTRLSVTPIDPRPVISDLGVCTVSGGVAAIAAGDLVLIRGTAVATLMSGIGNRVLGWNVAYKELWAAAEEADTLIYNVVTSDSYIRTDLRPRFTGHPGHGLILGMPDGRLLDASAESDSNKRIMLTFRNTLPKAASINGVSIRLFGSRVVGTIRFTADNGAPARSLYRLVEFLLDGQLDRPIEAKVYSHPFRYVTLTIDLTATADTRLLRALFTTG